MTVYSVCIKIEILPSRKACKLQVSLYFSRGVGRGRKK